MKILQVIPYFVPAWDYGGPLRGTYELSKELVKRGHEVTVYTTDTLDANHGIDKLEEVIDGIKVRRFRNISNSFANKHNVFLANGMVYEVRNNLSNFEVIHLHEYRTIQNMIVHHYAKKYRSPYILQAHGSLPQDTPKQWLKKLYDYLFGHRLLRDASKLIALTETEVEQYKSIGINEGKIEIVPNGVNLVEFQNLPLRGEFRKKWAISDDQMIILFLARIHKIKGPDLLAKAFARIIKEVRDVKLVFVGPDGGYLPEVQRLVLELGIEKEVLFTGPFYGRDKLEAYVDADVYVLPSVYETFPISVIEACACGTPVIVTDRCGIANTIDRQTGLVVPYDEDALGKAISDILSDDNKKHEYGVKGKSLVREQFNWEKIAKQVESIYSSCLSSKT